MNYECWGSWDSRGIRESEFRDLLYWGKLKVRGMKKRKYRSERSGIEEVDVRGMICI